MKRSIATCGQVVTIPGSDRTVFPKYLLRVHATLVDGTAELVNCTRLACPVSEGAMRPLNCAANLVFE